MRSILGYRFLPLLALAAACTPQLAVRGNLVDNDRLEQIAEGRSTRDDVAQILGTPTLTGSFEDNIWYYVGERTEQKGIMAPQPTERRIVAIRFDDAGKVEEISESGLDTAVGIEPDPDRTPTAGRDVGIMQQLLGNIGRFNSSGDSK